MRIAASLFPLLAVLFFMASCEDKTDRPKDTLSTGNLSISVDETFRPVVEAQLRVFDSSYPDAHITASYKPESECIQDFINQKATLVLVTRPLSAEEKKFCEQKKIYVTSLALARDAVAVVVPKGSGDSILSRPQLEGILTGENAKKYKVVFDNSGSSTLRFMQDSILGNRKLGANVFAAKSNEAVIDYVQKTPGSIGFVGLSYVLDSNATNPEDPFLHTVRVAALTADSTREILQPYQAYIALRNYPLTRTLYYINSQGYPGLGTGFANFLAEERGQLIFKTASFFPLRSNIVIKEAVINTEPLH